MTIHNIDVNTLKQWQAKNDVTLVDVREAVEWHAGYIAGATLVPLNSVSAAAMPETGGKKLVIYCRSGKRSVTACEILQNEIPALDVYNLEGGILAWEAMLAK